MKFLRHNLPIGEMPTAKELSREMLTRDRDKLAFRKALQTVIASKQTGQGNIPLIGSQLLQIEKLFPAALADVPGLFAFIHEIETEYNANIAAGNDLTKEAATTV